MEGRGQVQGGTQERLPPGRGGRTLSGAPRRGRSSSGLNRAAPGAPSEQTRHHAAPSRGIGPAGPAASSAGSQTSRRRVPAGARCPVAGLVRRAGPCRSSRRVRRAAASTAMARTRRFAGERPARPGLAADGLAAWARPAITTAASRAVRVCG